MSYDCSCLRVPIADSAIGCSRSQPFFHDDELSALQVDRSSQANVYPTTSEGPKNLLIPTLHRFLDLEAAASEKFSDEPGMFEFHGQMFRAALLNSDTVVIAGWVYVLYPICRAVLHLWLTVTLNATDPSLSLPPRSCASLTCSGLARSNRTSPSALRRSGSRYD
jgi:hypothetical protein